MTLDEAKKWMERGVVIVDHNTTYLDEEVVIKDGTTIYPNVSIRGNSIIGESNIIDSNSVIIDSIIGDNNKIFSSYISDTKIGDNNYIGPFAHMRDGVELGNNNKVGNFVEVKDSVIGNNNFFSHLSYVGDSEIGNGINFSAGAITANFDWITKERKKTVIEDDVMVGANSVLVAPITLNKKAFVAAGSVIDKDVEKGALAIARPRPEIKKNYIKES